MSQHHGFEVDYNSKATILVTWAKMPKHCRHCKKSGHIREKCPERSSETRTCYTCGVKGRLSVNCKRALPTDTEFHKRACKVAPASSEEHIPNRQIDTENNIIADARLYNNVTPAVSEPENQQQQSPNKENVKELPIPNRRSNRLSKSVPPSRYREETLY
ncbi:hypothetical protein BY458DRAFT_561226 [Sporodiniella umbellata]|nr:hypothetical protein BY458DRAFT_561226 [Sporodiniella umbellata]